jgi:SAM-dependent methyltransferase
MTRKSEGQVTRNAAEVYEEFFVPALFQEWAEPVADAARLAPGQKVLDVACGTGVLARAAARRVRPDGAVVGLDRNEGMLAVAGRLSRDIEWRQGRAESLPFPDGAFDAVVSQFGLMFFEDRAAALREMRRVLKSRGRLAVAVWDVLDHNSGYAAMAALLHRLFGPSIADELRVPFALGEPDGLRSLFAAAGIPNVEIVTPEGQARFPSIAAWVDTDVKGWTLADKIDDAQHRLLVRKAEEELRTFARPDGTVVFRVRAHIATTSKM